MDQQQLALLRGRRTILLVFDDMGDRPIDADIVLNHNLYGATIDYSRLTRATVLRGPECTLIDRRILEARVAHESNVGTGIVISFGGTDDGTRAAELARHLLPEFAGPIHIVVAPGVAPSPDVRKLTAKMPDRVILQHGPDMPPLLAGARLYLGGAGMTALEALVIGLDMVLCVISDNQRLNAEAFGRFGHAVVQGLEPKEAAAIAVSLLRKPYSPRSSPVDGRGGARVVAAIEQLLASKRKD
ncbi:MAG TPA: hypothetical protein VGQ35_16205 [Dongiaceae bacterium]|nr:hypothetical protein [Dongiaceae bacterium]